MTTAEVLLAQIRELDSHISRLLVSAREMQDAIRGKFQECPACMGEGSTIERCETLNGLPGFAYSRPCDRCGASGRILKQ